jgi:hypothetical protein
MLQLNNATTGSGFNFFTAYSGVTGTDTYHTGGTQVAKLDGAGNLSVAGNVTQTGSGPSQWSGVDWTGTSVTVPTGFNFSIGVTSAGLFQCQLSSGSSCMPSASMVYPGAGVPNSTGTAWGTSLTAFGSQAGVATSADPGTTVNVPMVADGSHGQKPSTSGALGTGAFATIANYCALAGCTMTGELLTPTAAITTANIPTIQQVADAIGSGGSSQTISVANGNVQTITLSANLAVSFTQPSSTTAKVMLHITQASSGGPYTVTWTSVKWPGGIAPVMSSAASASDWYSCILDGTNTYCTAGQNFQ